MIQAVQLTKTFDDFTALDQFNAHIQDGSIYGLVGSNGSGKSTLLRLISGIYRPDGGDILVDNAPPFENTSIKDLIFHVSDDLYFLPQTTMDDMARFYQGVYSRFDSTVYGELCQRFPIDAKKKLHTFSKGMRRQVALILSLACCPKYLLLDEAFDGLDPVMRGAVRKILADRLADGGMSVVIASHNLRELEDLCDHMGLLHQGKVIFEREIDEVKLGFCKVQAAFALPPAAAVFQEQLNVMQMDVTGSVVNLIVRGSSREVLGYVQSLSPLFAESIPLTLEEVFIHEMEAVGYDYNKIIF
ncbi:ABC transporter ATP-binding protein [Ruminococcaceae bacterium OttesenSCG-928-L11]|nr:ABC transporter ATP-binding protein [Ruminococcaceae bacterium OttesenSCG-928-L11]